VDFITGLFNSAVMLVAFVGILWTISGSLTFTAFGQTITIPGYMVWAALIYALIGSVLTYVVGRPMVQLNTERMAQEAGFRFNLVRARESSEGIALIGGERTSGAA
jgi:putative ATP-binding cassette transporter